MYVDNFNPPGGYRDERRRFALSHYKPDIERGRKSKEAIEHWQGHGLRVFPTWLRGVVMGANTYTLVEMRTCS